MNFFHSDVKNDNGENNDEPFQSCILKNLVIPSMSNVDQFIEEKICHLELKPIRYDTYSENNETKYLHNFFE
jgi:hypothetical protein